MKTGMVPMWLSLGAIAAVVVACAAGEDNTDVQVASETNLPRCNADNTDLDQTRPADPPNAERNVDNNGGRVSSSSGATSSGSGGGRATETGGTTGGGGASSGSDSNASSGSGAPDCTTGAAPTAR